ncbi:low affinity vacuolar monovalent cation/H(+) antiporter isoform X1 [Alosa sapidissima]|uniref:low affinity vacuolar monovalent cation/H(+) antiporter isoform X1 n=1 Tax=Alosa sapidissima TaxID=34773 RepID=UPI001C0A5D96|nr:low affinity vacuolar monovalent cation/H(+) antiporter isoform X1 [Alosa sapidissima]
MSSESVHLSADSETRRRRIAADNPDETAGEPPWGQQNPRGRGLCCDATHLLHEGLDGHSLPCISPPLGPYSSASLCRQRSHSLHAFDDTWDDGRCKTTISAENEVEAQKQANNYKFGFRKWKSHITERPFEVRSEVVKELYSELNVIKVHTGSLISCGNVLYVFLFGWWLALVYALVSLLMFCTLIGFPYGELCWNLSGYFLWPFGKSITEGIASERRPKRAGPDTFTEEVEEHNGASSILLPTPVEDVFEESQAPHKTSHWRRVSTYVWLLLGYPVLAIFHSLACLLSWLLVVTIPVAKMNARAVGSILLLPPEEVHISRITEEPQTGEDKALLCCNHALNGYYYKYTVDGINVFAVNLLPLVIFALVIGYIDKDNKFASSEVKFATAIGSIIPLSYYIGMGIASISAQSNFAVGAVVNATFGSITEMTFYITALLRGHREGNQCLQEIVKAALTGTLLGCILFIPGICMIIGGLRHSEQRFNSRSAGVSSSLLFISIGGVFAPTLFSKAYGNLTCEGCSSTATNATTNTTGPYVCHNCHYDLSENNYTMFHSHVEPLVHSVSVLLPLAYIIGLIFTLKTHSHIYDIHVGDNNASGHLGAVVHWSRWRALFILIVATVLMSACADLTTEHIQPILSQPGISQYFIGVTVLAMVPEIPEIVNGIQFALQNNISLSLEVGSCIAVQVCMIQIPLLILFNAIYDVGFVLIFSDLHLWASIFSVILVNYIFMDGKSDYFQGTSLVVVYLILLATYYFAPSPAGC